MHAELPAQIVLFSKPVGVVEGRVGQHEVGAQIRMQAAPEAVGVLDAEVGLDAAQGQVHHRQAASGVLSWP